MTTLRKLAPLTAAILALALLGWGVMHVKDQRDRTALRKDLGQKHSKSMRAEPGSQLYKQVLGALGNPDPNIRLRALQLLPDSAEAVDVVIGAASDPIPEIRQYAGYRLEGLESDKAANRLDRAVRDNDSAVVAGAWEYFSGPLATRREQEALAAAVLQYGTEDMMHALINDRRPILSHAATAWATQHGYTVIPNYR